MTRSNPSTSFTPRSLNAGARGEPTEP
jgi:hypothetical protein